MGIGGRDPKVKISLPAAGPCSVVVDGVHLENLCVSVTVKRGTDGFTTAVIELVDVELDAETEHAIATILPRNPQEVDRDAAVSGR